MRHLGNKLSAETFAKGFATYYTFIKPHAALNGRAPAQAANVATAKNTWLNLILKTHSEGKQK